MNYLIALVVTPLLAVFWVLIQGWAADSDDAEVMGRCEGCTCGKALVDCERRST